MGYPRLHIGRPDVLQLNFLRKQACAAAGTRSIVVSVENEEERHPRRYGRARRRSALGDARDRRETHVASKVRTPSPIRARTHSDAVRI